MGFVLLQVSYPMWCPESFESPSGTYTAPLPVTGQTYNFNNSQGLMYEAAEVRRCINAGQSDVVPRAPVILAAHVDVDK